MSGYQNNMEENNNDEYNSSIDKDMDDLIKSISEQEDEEKFKSENTNIEQPPFTKDYEDEEEDESFSLDEVDETKYAGSEENKKLDEYQNEINYLKNYIAKLDELLQKNPRLVSRVENKPDFVVEVINSPSNQKIANLSNYEIDELLKRRRCKNFLDVFNWKITCSLIQKNIQDIENYSLSKDGFLIKLTLVEHLKHFSSSQQEEVKRRRILRQGDEYV